MNVSTVILLLFLANITRDIEKKNLEYERKISIITYLNDGFDGGGTEFPHKVYKPQAGYAVMFPSNWCYPHSGQPVPNGKKRVAVTWYYVQNIHATKK